MVFKEIVKALLYALLGIALFLILVLATSCAFALKTDDPTVKWYSFHAEQGLFIRHKDDVLTPEQANGILCTRDLKNLAESLHIYHEQAEQNK